MPGRGALFEWLPITANMLGTCWKGIGGIASISLYLVLLRVDVCAFTRVCTSHVCLHARVCVRELFTAAVGCAWECELFVFRSP